MIEPKVIREVIGKNEYEFRIYETTFMVYRVSKKAYGGFVGEGWYDYKGNEEILKKAIDGFVAKVLAKEMIKEQRKKERLEKDKREKKEMIDSINVGDLLHDSRGYDMTINDYLQVCDKKGNKVFCRKVGKECVSGDAGFTGTEKPVKDGFIDEGKRYVIGKYGIKLNDYRHARKSEWDRDYYFNYMD